LKSPLQLRSDAVKWERFKEQLSLEIQDYLADLRDFRDALRSVEGWIALVLLLVSMLLVGVFLFMSMGFSPNPNSEVTTFLFSVGLKPCRPMDNITGVILFVNLFMLLFLVVITLGNVLNLIGRVKRGEPREPRDLIISASMLMVVGTGGIIFMTVIC
jgi:hypothetical protein